MIPEWLGTRPYGPMLQAQRERREQILLGAQPEAFWLLEHTPVITTGRRAAADVPSAQWLAERGVERFETERGGLATYHGPGQLVGYLMVDLNRRPQLTVKGYVAGLEAGLIAFLATIGVQAGRRSGYPGVWVGTDKVAALGVHFRRGVSMHGFALNLTTDLTPFGWITPCGITDGGVASIEQITGISLPPASVSGEVADHVLAEIR